MSDDKVKKKLDRILEEVQPRIGEEVGGLIGGSLTFSDFSTQLISKEDFFDEPSGKVIFAEIQVTGDIEGDGCLLISVKDAIRLGGTLIMLPESELEEVVASEEYSEELEDSYGEIANIIAGSYTKTFEEMYPKQCRFIRKKQQLITPVKVDGTSDDLIPNQNYYQVSNVMSYNDKALGILTMLLPAAAFGMDEQVEGADTAGNAEETDDSADTAVVEDDVASADTESAAENSAETPEKKAAPKISPEKAKQKLNKVLEEVQPRISEEVGGLIGGNLAFTDFSARVISKEDFFDQPLGKMIFAEMQVTGDIEGDGCMLISVKDAVRLGGTLIMLPESELEAVVASEDYSEEIEDSYGEIANIIAGSYTKTFEDMYPRACRFIRKQQQLITPVKIDGTSDELIPCQNYYQVSCKMSFNDKKMGALIVLLPAAAFGVDAIAEEVVSEAADTVASTKDSAAGTGSEQAPSEEVSGAAAKSFDVKKQKKRVDAVLGKCISKVQEEVSAILGTEITLTDQENRIVSKEDYFFDEASGKQILAHMDVVGDIEDKSYLYVGLKDAIYIGGTLIMLPPAELDIVVADEEFSDDTEDAYGEITNIIAGVYTSVFEEQYTRQLRFIKTGLEKVVPLKVDTESDTPMPDQDYYMSSTMLSIGANEMGKIQMLFPISLLELDLLAADSADDAGETAETSAIESGPTGSTSRSDGSSSGEGQVGSVSSVGGNDPAFLIVSNDDEECAKITAVLDGQSLGYRVLSHKESVNDYLPGSVKAIILLMTEVNENGMGVAIKISGGSSLPLIAAGPAWTRSKVIKAVKYGVDDILLTPADESDIAEKIRSVTASMAA